MTERLRSPGITSLETKGSVSNIRGADLGISWMIGIAEWGEVGKPIEVLSYPDFEKKCGSFLNGYYLAKSAHSFFKNGGYKLYVVRTCHYTNGVADAVKASYTFKGYNEGDDDRTKVDTLKIKALSEGSRGNKINVTNQKASTTLNGQLTASSHTSAVVDDVTGFSIGDVVDISDGTHYVRVIVTSINSGTNTIYFKAVTLGAIIADGADVKTPSTHKVSTVLTEDLVSNATSMKVSNVSGIAIGQVLSIIDTQSGSPNSLSVVVTDISEKTISFADIGTITTISAVNSKVVSQEFNITVYFNETVIGDVQKYLSMSSLYEEGYIENRFKSELVSVEDLASTEESIGDIPEVFHYTYLTGGDDGLVGLADADFVGSETYKNGLYAFGSLPDMFAQLSSPDKRSAVMHNAMDEYAKDRLLWVEYDFDFDLTPEEAKEYVTETALLNTNMGEINYPNILWRNPNTDVISAIPQSGATMGLNSRVWGAIDKGPWIAPAGVEDGLYQGIEGLESDYTQDRTYRDLLYENRINALYKYPLYGDLKYGIRTLEVDGEFPQVPERVVFLYCRHSIVQGTPWSVFKLIDTTNLQRLKRTIEKFLTGIWKSGGLKGATPEEAFSVDVSEESVNTLARQEAGEMWCSIGLATKKAGEFVYFEFHKKIG